MPVLEAIRSAGAATLNFMAQAAGSAPEASPGGAPPQVTVPEADFQAYIFWAYGLACALLLVFGIWTAVRMRDLSRRVDALQDRVDDSAAS